MNWTVLMVERHLVWTFSLVHSLVFHKWNLQVFHCGVSGHVKAWQGPPLSFCASSTNNTSCFTSVQAVPINVLTTACILFLKKVALEYIAQDKLYADLNLYCISLINLSISRWDFLTFWDWLRALFGLCLVVLARVSSYVVWKEIRGSQHLEVP